MRHWQEWGYVALWLLPFVGHVTGWQGVVVIGLCVARDALNAFLESKEPAHEKTKLSALEDRIESLETEVAFKGR